MCRVAFQCDEDNERQLGLGLVLSLLSFSVPPNSYLFNQTNESASRQFDRLLIVDRGADADKTRDEVKATS